MKKPKNKVLKKTVGVIFLVFGVIGLFLPIIQGIILIILGLAFLGYPRAEKILEKLKKK